MINQNLLIMDLLYEFRNQNQLPDDIGSYKFDIEETFKLFRMSNPTIDQRRLFKLFFCKTLMDKYYELFPDGERKHFGYVLRIFAEKSFLAYAGFSSNASRTYHSNTFEPSEGWAFLDGFKKLIGVYIDHCADYLDRD